MRNRPDGYWLLALALLTIGTGLYFMFLRPAILPEDARFAGLDLQTLPAGLSVWLSLVFRTWGAFMVGFGVVLTGIAGFLVTGRPGWLRAGTALGIGIAFLVFLVSNLRLRSDFLWYVGALAFLAGITAARLAGIRSHLAAGTGPAQDSL